MLSDKSTVCPLNLLDIAHQKRGVKAAIVNAGKTLPMLSVMDSVKERLIEPVFIGDENKRGEGVGELHPCLRRIHQRKARLTGARPGKGRPAVLPGCLPI